MDFLLHVLLMFDDETKCFSFPVFFWQQQRNSDEASSVRWNSCRVQSWDQLQSHMMENYQWTSWFLLQILSEAAVQPLKVHSWLPAASRKHQRFFPDWAQIIQELFLPERHQSRADDPEPDQSGVRSASWSCLKSDLVFQPAASSSKGFHLISDSEAALCDTNVSFLSESLRLDVGTRSCEGYLWNGWLTGRNLLWLKPAAWWEVFRTEHLQMNLRLIFESCCSSLRIRAPVLSEPSEFISKVCWTCQIIGWSLIGSLVEMEMRQKPNKTQTLVLMLIFSPEQLKWRNSGSPPAEAMKKKHLCLFSVLHSE